MSQEVRKLKHLHSVFISPSLFPSKGMDVSRPHNALPELSLTCLLCSPWDHAVWKLNLSKYVYII